MRLLVLCSFLFASASAVEPPAPAPEQAPAQAPAPAPNPELGLRTDLWTFGLTGLRLFGIIGGAAETSLRYEPGWSISPELSASLGVAGSKFALGGRWTLGERQWLLSNEGLKADVNVETSITITPRAVAEYRWLDEERHPAVWRGIVSRGGWYYGGEVGVSIHSVAFDLAVTWSQRDTERSGPYVTLASGLSF